MKSVVIQIGNSDDKLSQKEWAAFVGDLHMHLEPISNVHFFGGSANFEPWQNVCCICEVQDEDVPFILETVKKIRERFKQDSAAVVVGESQFV